MGNVTHQVKSSVTADVASRDIMLALPGAVTSAFLVAGERGRIKYERLSADGKSPIFVEAGVVVHPEVLSRDRKMVIFLDHESNKLMKLDGKSGVVSEVPPSWTDFALYRLLRGL